MSETASTSSASAEAGRVSWVGRCLGPLLAIVVYLLLPPSGAGVEVPLTEAGRATAAIGVLMAVLWMTEAMPLPVTALLPLVLFPLAGVLEMNEAASPYANPVIFLFMGGFMLALATERWGLHKRIALLTIMIVGTRPRRMIAGFMVATAVMSMWISNTATTVMMLPIAVSVIMLTTQRLRAAGHELAFDEEGNERPLTGPDSINFASSLMLGIAYAASIGGIGTLIGTPPNAFLAGFLESEYGVEIGFGEWMLIGVPFSIVFLIIAWFWLTSGNRPIRLKELPGGREIIRQEFQKLGRVSRGEWGVFIVFMATAFCWVFGSLIGGVFDRLTDASIAIGAAVLLFAIPVDPRKGIFLLNWEAARRLPWGVLLLFGGGLSLAAAVSTSGLDAWIGARVQILGALPLVLIVAFVAALVIFLTELTSNTATASTFLPILGGVAIGLDAEPMLLMVPAAVAASCAFMMPVATPPNAIVFGSGHVTIGEMVKAGFVLNLIGIVLVTLLMFTLGGFLR